MTFLELCEYTFELVNRHPASFDSVDLKKVGGEWAVPDPEQRKVIRAVQAAYLMILNLSKHWSFFYKRGLLFTLEAGKAEYRPGRFDSLVEDSLYLKKGTARYPLIAKDYLFVMEQQRLSELPAGTPIFFAVSPDLRWWLWPTPAEVFEVWGEGVLKADGLLNAGDQPPWDEPRHVLVGDLAARLWEMQIDTQEEMISRLNAEGRGIGVLSGINRLLADYTEGFA